MAAVAEGPAAITLSRGGAEKTYTYTDPNEDACCFALGAGGSLVAVADGHHGARGAERVIRWLLGDVARVLTAERPRHGDRDAWAAAARQLIADAHAEVLAQADALHIAPAPTTLSVALVRPAEDLLVHASIGDSHVFVVPADSSAGTRDVAWESTGRRRTFFAGEPFPGGAPEADQMIVGCQSLAGALAVVVASDGLSEHGIGVRDPAATVDACARAAVESEARLRPLEAARAVTDAALAAHRANRSGDNVAVATTWLGAPFNE
jgi:hypothetical protein